MAWSTLLLPQLRDAHGSRLRFPQVALEIVVALSMAFLVWLYFRTRDHESLDHVPVPVEIALTPGQAGQYYLEMTGSPHVVVSFVGSPAQIRELRGMLQRGEVRVKVPVSVPDDHLDDSRYKATVRVQGGDVPVPPGITVLVVEGGNRIPVVLHRIVERNLPVHLNHAVDDRIREVLVEPSQVVVRGPQYLLERANAILTRPYRLPASTAVAPGQAKVLSVELALVRELEGRPIQATPGKVKVRLTLQPPPQTYKVSDVTIKFLCPPSFPYRVQFLNDRTGKITLQVKAPAPVPPASVVAVVDLTGDVKPGLNVEPVRLQLPRDCQLVQDPPGPVGFALVPTETAPGTLLGVGAGP